MLTPARIVGFMLGVMLLVVFWFAWTGTNPFPTQTQKQETAPVSSELVQDIAPRMDEARTNRTSNRKTGTFSFRRNGSWVTVQGYPLGYFDVDSGAAKDDTYLAVGLVLAASEASVSLQFGPTDCESRTSDTDIKSGRGQLCGLGEFTPSALYLRWNQWDSDTVVAADKGITATASDFETGDWVMVVGSKNTLLKKEGTVVLWGAQ